MVNYSSMSCKKQNDIILKINLTGFIYIRSPSIQNRTKLKYHKMSSNERVNMAPESNKAIASMLPNLAL